MISIPVTSSDRGSVLKGVVLAGGEGTRLRPTTRAVNKHLLPVYDEPMIFYAVRALVESGIEDILVVSTPDDVGRVGELLEPAFDADFTYRVQRRPRGIADAIRLARNFVDERFAVVLGDNVVLDDISDAVASFAESDKAAKLFLTRVDDPSRYGIARLNDGDVVAIEEKPDAPSTDLAVIGLYLYTGDVFDYVDELEPSDRGELEITDVNDRYAAERNVEYEILDGDWFDAGTPEGMYRASERVRENR